MTAHAAGSVVRVPISFDDWYRPLSYLVGLPPSTAYVALAGSDVDIHMGWAFRARVPRAAVAASEVLNIRPLSRGVHGFGGRWLVNGSGRTIVSIRLSAAQRAYVLGVPVRLREALVSVDQPGALVAALSAPA